MRVSFLGGWLGLGWRRNRIRTRVKGQYEVFGPGEVINGSDDENVVPMRGNGRRD